MTSASTFTHTAPVTSITPFTFLLYERHVFQSVIIKGKKIKKNLKEMWLTVKDKFFPVKKGFSNSLWMVLTNLFKSKGDASGIERKELHFWRRQRKNLSSKPNLLFMIIWQRNWLYLMADVILKLLKQLVPRWLKSHQFRPLTSMHPYVLQKNGNSTELKIKKMQIHFKNQV